MPESRMRFTVLFPLLNLIAAVLLVALPTTLVFFRLESYAQRSDTAAFDSGRFHAEIPRKMFLRDSLMWGTGKTSHVIGALDMPGSVAMIAGRPPSIVMDAWRAIILPFASLPFWWLVGLGFEAALRRVRLHWSVLLTGTIFMVIFIFLLCGLEFGLSASERAESDMTWVICGMALWALLFAAFPIAWLRTKAVMKVV